MMSRLIEPVAHMAEHEDEPLTQAKASPGPPRVPGPAGTLGAPHLPLSADPAAQLRWAQKVEALGRLSGRVAHEINNLVTLMLGRTTLLLQHAEAPVAHRDDIAELHHAAERIARLMRQWLMLGRKDKPSPRRLDLNALLVDLGGLFAVALGENVRLVSDLAASPARVLADPSHVEQVVLNLVLNARDAMGGRGTLTVRTANVELGGLGGDFLMPFAPGPYIVLSVRDSGSGMDRATLARAFEPYFTTKGPAKGSGLGLHHVWEIVKEAGGTIAVSSAPGQGSVFAVYLPQVREWAEAPAGGAPAEPPPAAQTILVVEDEDLVRSVVREVLRREGYTVLEARDARAALAVAAAHAGPIHLLVTDCVLPHVPGGELASRLAGRYPGLKVLYISGYPLTEGALPGGAGVVGPFLQKPFTPAGLTDKVGDLLGRRR
jgi:CheY-like chemotaxis protein